MIDKFKYNFSKSSILIVDDEELTLKYLTRNLEDYFSCVITAKDTKEALYKFETNKIDIILTDFFMPEKTGLDFIKQIRKNGYETPVIYMSSYPETDILLEMIKQQISGFLLKPIDLNELLNLIENTIGAMNKNSNLSLSYNNCQEYKLASGVIVDLKYKKVQKNNELIFLTKKEFELLELFINNEKYILTKEQIEEMLWLGIELSAGRVKNLLAKLRIKIGHKAILTVKNLGYKLVLEEGV